MGYGTHTGVVKSIDDTWRRVEVTFEPTPDSMDPEGEVWPIARDITQSFLANVEVGDLLEYDISYDTDPYLLIEYRPESSSRTLLERVQRIEKHLGLTWPEE